MKSDRYSIFGPCRRLWKWPEHLEANHQISTSWLVPIIISFTEKDQLFLVLKKGFLIALLLAIYVIGKEELHESTERKVFKVIVVEIQSLGLKTSGEISRRGRIILFKRSYVQKRFLRNNEESNCSLSDDQHPEPDVESHQSP